MTAFDEGAFKSRDARSYDGVAPAFDRLSARFSAAKVRRLLALASPQPLDHLLDVGTGTGLVARQAAGRLGVKGRVLGIDLSEGMLRTADAEAAREGLAGRVAFQRMDAEALDLEDESFDVVTSLLALGHLPDPSAGLREMYRVLKPGGRLVIGIGSGPPLLSYQGLGRVTRRLSDMVGRLLGRQLTACEFLDVLTHKYLPGVTEREEAPWVHAGVHRPRTVSALVRAAGFGGVRCEWQGERTEILSAEEFWELQVTFSSIARKRVAGASPAAVERLRSEFMATCQRVHARGGTLVYPSGVLFVTAQRPQA